MGVIYKLTDDVVAFILDEKRKSADLSCRELVNLVMAQFGREVSKSSVHEVLKEANIVSPRGRKLKNKFQIPDDKKAQLIARLPPAIVATIPTVPMVIEPELSKEIKEPEEILPDLTVEATKDDVDEAPLKLRVEPMVLAMPDESLVKTNFDMVFLPPLEEDHQTINARDIFIQAAFYDLFPAPWIVESAEELNSLDTATIEKEAAYRLLGVANFKVELKDGSVVFIGARMQRIGGEFLPEACLLPIESAVLRMADHLLNNIQPLIIREISTEFLDAAVYDVLKLMDNVPNKNMARISLLDKEGDSLIDFENIPSIKRNFILGINPNNKDIKDAPIENNKINSVASYVNEGPVRFISQDALIGEKTYRCLVIISNEKIPLIKLISNMPKSTTDEELITQYVQKFAFESEGVRGTENNTEQTNFCLKHAQYLFGDIVSGEKEQELMNLKTKGQFNAKIKITNILIPTAYDHKEALIHACTKLNNLNIPDRQGRKMWVKVSYSV